jgi:hypothetical protein
MKSKIQKIINNIFLRILMKLEPKFSYEYNQILNKNIDEKKQISLFTTLLTDKDRFLSKLKLFEEEINKIENFLGFKIKSEDVFYIVNVEDENLFSFSEPITVNYHYLPNVMYASLIKEIIKVSINNRFPNEILRDLTIFEFIKFIIFEKKMFNFLNIKKDELEILEKLNLNKYKENYRNLSKEISLDFEENSFKNEMDKLLEKYLY